MTSSRSLIHPSWVVVLAGVCAALHVGKIPPALPVLQAALSLSLVQAGFLLSMVQLAGMTLGLVVGLSVDSVGLRRSMLAGLGLLTLASALGGFATGIDVLLVLRAMEGFGFLWVVMPAPALIRRCVSAAQLNTRMGQWSAYMPLGTATALLVGSWMLSVWPWPVWWWLLSGVSALAWWMVWTGITPDLPKEPEQASVAQLGAVLGWRQRLSQTLRARGPWLLSLTFGVYAAQWLAVIGFLPTVYAGLGVAEGLSGLLTAGVALANMGGNLASGRLLQRGWQGRQLLFIGFGTMALGAMGAFGQWDGEGLPMVGRYLSVILLSAVGGLIPGTLFALAMRLAPSPDTLSTTVGWMQQWSATGQFFGPPLVAWVAALVGGWEWTWAVTGSCCVMGIGLAVAIDRALRAAPTRA
jgi:CP family cyanate transporter-like MFS transporter